MIRAIITVTTFLFACSALASNFNFLHEAAPMSDFNKEDMELFKATIQTALNEKKDGENKIGQKREGNDQEETSEIDQAKELNHLPRVVPDDAG